MTLSYPEAKTASDVDGNKIRVGDTIRAIHPRDGQPTGPEVRVVKLHRQGYDGTIVTTDPAPEPTLSASFQPRRQVLSKGNDTMIASYLQVGRRVDVRMGMRTWSPGTVVERNLVDVVVDVNGQRVTIHQSVIRRDVRKRIDKCWISRAEFLTAIGVVNAKIEPVRSGLRIVTKYDGVADRIDSMARGIFARVLRTRTDDGTVVITIKGFRKVPRHYIQSGRRRRYFDSLEDARVVADAIFERTGVVVGISVAQ